MFGGLLDFAKDNKMLTAGLGTLALGALSSPEEEETRNPDYGRPGEAWDVEYRGVRYDLDDPEERDAYNARKAADRQEYNEREPVLAADGGAMYGRDKMIIDTPITGEVNGPGTGTSDSVPARLSDGEFVLTAKSVRGANGGDRDIGAAFIDMMAELGGHSVMAVQEQTVTQRLAPFQEDFLKDIFAQATALKGGMGYTDQKMAGLSPEQRRINPSNARCRCI